MYWWCWWRFCQNGTCSSTLKLQSWPAGCCHGNKTHLIVSLTAAKFAKMDNSEHTKWHQMETEASSGFTSTAEAGDQKSKSEKRWWSSPPLGPPGPRIRGTILGKVWIEVDWYWTTEWDQLWPGKPRLRYLLRVLVHCSLWRSSSGDQWEGTALSFEVDLNVSCWLWLVTRWKQRQKEKKKFGTVAWSMITDHWSLINQLLFWISSNE